MSVMDRRHFNLLLAQATFVGAIGQPFISFRSPICLGQDIDVPKKKVVDELECLLSQRSMQTRMLVQASDSARWTTSKCLDFAIEVPGCKGMEISALLVERERIFRDVSVSQARTLESKNVSRLVSAVDENRYPLIRRVAVDSENSCFDFIDGVVTLTPRCKTWIEAASVMHAKEVSLQVDSEGSPDTQSDYASEALKRAAEFSRSLNYAPIFQVETNRRIAKNGLWLAQVRQKLAGSGVDFAVLVNPSNLDYALDRFLDDIGDARLGWIAEFDFDLTTSEEKSKDDADADSPDGPLEIAPNLERRGQAAARKLPDDAKEQNREVDNNIVKDSESLFYNAELMNNLSRFPDRLIRAEPTVRYLGKGEETSAVQIAVAALKAKIQD